MVIFHSNVSLPEASKIPELNIWRINPRVSKNPGVRRLFGDLAAVKMGGTMGYPNIASLKSRKLTKFALDHWYIIPTPWDNIPTYHGISQHLFRDKPLLKSVPSHC
jgi:hypothetical protein